VVRRPTHLVDPIRSQEWRQIELGDLIQHLSHSMIRRQDTPDHPDHYQVNSLNTLQTTANCHHCAGKPT
jgi:hypothetical protein